MTDEILFLCVLGAPQFEHVWKNPKATAREAFQPNARIPSTGQRKNYVKLTYRSILGVNDAMIKFHFHMTVWYNVIINAEVAPM